MFWLLIVAVLILLVTYIRGQSKRPLNYPRGPPWLPIVGNLPMLKELSKKYGGQHLALTKLAEKYKTNVLGLKLGGTYVVTVFSYNTVKSVLLGEEYEGRPHNFFMELRSMGTNKGVTGTDGALWKIQRNFVTTHLRSLGFGKTRMEQMLKEEIGEVLTLLGENDGEIQIGRILAPAVINILWALTSGSRINRKDPRLQRIIELFDRRTKAFDLCGGTLSQHPWLRFVAPEKTGFNLINKLNFELRRLFLETINEHKRTWYEDRSDDLIHAFISEMNNSDEDESTFVEDQLIMVCLDIFIAGSQTTSNTLDFAFLAMVLYPDIQNKVQECLDAEFGKSGEISYADRSRVPYVEATLLEIERFYTVTPIIGPRRVLRDAVLEGYDIPKDTTVLISLHSIHFDKEYWRDPEVFRPERFLNEMGQVILQERVIPFGLGKRRCLGESLARNCVFLFFSEVLRKYNVTVWPGSNPPTGIPSPGITLSPEKYRAKFVTR